ncbi:MAG TPA: LptF/LptG family permease, partial [Phycisphaerae bacterium]|nr:LptF/LptG family permease [Phycisphaerae bacterium]
MIGILQRYITRELAKTFVLAAIGLTLTFTLCGGVLNMVRAEVLTAVQLLRILGFVLPISLTLTLPISALFACAIVYGRLAADNEFDACRASGINIHRLLAPAIGLSLFTAAFTYTFTNHLIPLFIERLDELVRRDIQKIVYSALSNQGHLKFRDYVLYAGDTYLDEEDAETKSIIVQQAAFLQLEGEK